jgi:hypothetical protein
MTAGDFRQFKESSRSRRKLDRHYAFKPCRFNPLLILLDTIRLIADDTATGGLRGIGAILRDILPDA